MRIIEPGIQSVSVEAKEERGRCVTRVVMKVVVRWYGSAQTMLGDVLTVKYGVPDEAWEDKESQAEILYKMCLRAVGKITERQVQLQEKEYASAKLQELHIKEPILTVSQGSETSGKLAGISPQVQFPLPTAYPYDTGSRVDYSYQSGTGTGDSPFHESSYVSGYGSGTGSGSGV